MLIPTEAASHAALRLLEAFVSTNSPDALLRALPRFRQNGVDSSVSQAGLMTTHEDEDSFLARSSRIIRDAKHCWELFREGFVKPYTDATASRTNGRKRKTTTKDIQYSDEEGGDDFEQPLAVAPYAWPVLQWLLSVIEKEEIWIERGGERKISLTAERKVTHTSPQSATPVSCCRKFFRREQRRVSHGMLQSHWR